MIKPQKCRACGHDFTEDAPTDERDSCPKCNLPRKGDVNRASIGAYLFFIGLMFAAGIVAYFWIRSFNIQ